MNFKQGFFKPKNPNKYIGDPTNIVYRSGWEKKVMEWADNNSSVIKWGSEEVVIPYVSPVDNRVHRYFVDFYVEAITNTGDKKIMLLEVKPAGQTQAPKAQKRRTKRYITEVVTYGVNQAKWKAAEDYCNNKGWEFRLVTESDIFGR